MPIADFQQKRTTVEFDGGEMSVRALSITDIATIVEIHEDAVDAIQAKIARHEGAEFSAELAAGIVLEIIRESPGMVARLIAMAADEHDQVGTVLKMPFTVQMEALKAIGILTFNDLAGAKKFYADVMDLIRGLRPEDTTANIAPAAEAA